MSHLKKNIDRPRHRFLVFSSVGNFSKANSWLGKRRNYDIWLTDYTDNKNPLEEKVDFLNYRRGAKWPNLKFAMESWPDIFSTYDAVWVADDDLELPPQQINKLFSILNEYQLLAAQPSFDPLGKNSYRITEEKPGYLLRYTNFVENGSTLIQRSTLQDFMKFYDPEVSSYGVDWLLMHFLGEQIDRRIAIIDRIRCHNPADWRKGGKREIDKFSSKANRRRIFEEYADKIGMTVHKDGIKELGHVNEKNPAITAWKYFRQRFFDKLKRKVRWVIRTNKFLKRHGADS